MALKKVLRSGVAAACIASVAAPAGVAAATAVKAAAQRGGVDVRVATAESFSRIEVGKGGSLRREGSTVVLTVERDDDPDIGRLLTSPPRFIKSAVRLPVAGKPQIVITLAEDADTLIGQADGASFANFFAKPPQPEGAPAQAEAEVAVAEPEPPRPNPLPPGGVVKMASKVANGQTLLTFTWANPAGAAVFRRGDAIWVVFDAPATLDVSSAPKVKPLRGVQAFKGADHAALRIDADPDAPIFVASQGSTWTIALGPGPQGQPAIVRVGRDPAGGPATLKAPVAGATRVINLPDPVVGDTLSVVTALGPPKGVPSRRDFVDAALLPSIQGLAIEPLADNVTVDRDGELVRISRSDATGLTLSPVWATRDREDAQLGAPQPASMPAIIPAEWANVGSAGFLRRYDSLLSAATVEGGNKDREAPVAARMALARFLVGSELSFEAIGVLNALAREHPEMLDDPEFRALRGVARTFARRYAEADADFSSPSLADDPSTALWRAYVNTQIAQYAEARSQFTKGIEAYGLMSPLWKARFARADAQAALAQGDLAAAEARINMSLEEKISSEEQLRSRLIQARVIELKGFQDRALRIYKAIATAPIDSIAAPAVLRGTQIRLQLGQINQTQAAAVYDGLRYRWRGDSTELETIRALGQLYLAQGRYREALEALRSAGVRLPDLPEAQQLQSDLNAAFRGLFLDGLADGLEPLQALALFFDFKELAPIGADGDLMVRKIVRRLVDVDLLPQAADLLKYQAENRLDGVPKAQVSTDLAVIYLMDRKPEQALEAINSSRTTVLPTALNAERRLIESRAWTALGRYDSALEVLGNDATKDGQDLRSEITWKQKNWAAAGPLFEKSLGDRWKNPTQLSSDEEGRLLRAGVAYSLAGDEGSLVRLQSRYQGFYDKANNPDALRIALTGLPTGRMSVGDFGRVSADNEAFAGWVEKMKGRFKTRAAPTSAARPAIGPAKQAQSAPATPAAKG